MRSMYWDILEHTWQIHNPDWLSYVERRDGVKESSKRRWYLSESAKAK